LHQLDAGFRHALGIHQKRVGRRLPDLLDPVAAH